MRLGIFICLFLSSEILFAKKPSPVDIRHINDDIVDAAPDFENFEEFMSKLDLDDDWEDLEDDQKEREERLAFLEKGNISSLSLGKRFKVHREMLELIFDQIVYLNFKNRHTFYDNYQLWLMEKLDKKPSLFSKDIENIRLKGLNIARTMARTYEKLENEYTSYMLIRMMTRTGNDNFEFYYRNFKKSFPKSQYINLVHHAVGEYYFSKKNYQRAEQQFKLAMADKSSSIRPYSIYKLAWTYQMMSLDQNDKKNNLKYKKKTDAAFKLALKVYDDWDAWKPVFPLKKEMTQDLAWFWAYHRDSEAKLREFLADIDRSEMIYEYYYFSAISYARTKDMKTSQKYFAAMYDHYKQGKRLPDLILKQISLSFQVGDLNALLDGYQKFVNLFHEENPWYEEWDGEPKVLSFNKDRLEYYLRNHAVQIHQNGQQVKQNAGTLKNQKQQKMALDQAQFLLNGAVQLYGFYEDTFPKSKFFVDLSFNHANLLFEMEQYEEAMKLFTSLGKSKSKISRDASYNAVMAAYNIDLKAPQSKLPEPGKAKEAVPLSASKKALVEKIDLFTKSFPQAGEAPQTMYTAGQIYYDHGDYQEAFKRFDELVQKSPKTAEGESALRSILSYYWENKDWKQVVKIASKYLIEPNIVAAGHEKFLRETLSYANSQLAISKK